MAKYLVQAPDHDTLVIAGLYGSQKFKHNSFMYSDEVAKLFPQFFFKVPEDETKEEPKKKDPKVVKEKEEPKKKEFESKKKAGRPKKKG